ncbi:MAG: HD domain-containing phosphohydrolase, partial [Rhodospirillales bacterium]
MSVALESRPSDDVLTAPVEAGKVLFVDDEENLLAAFRRTLRRRFDFHTATGGAEALDRLKHDGPFAVVISDMNMPGMDGARFLEAAREISEDTVRIMLTGNADQGTAVSAVNRAEVFRFLTKPCSPEELSATIDKALAQHRLLRAEKDLLEKTLSGAVKMLVDILSMVSPEAFARSNVIRSWALTLVRALRLPSPWQVNIATLLSQIGWATVPPEVAHKALAQLPLEPAEAALIDAIPENTRNLVANIPRLEAVSKALYFQGKGLDGSGLPARVKPAPEEIPLVARLLKILNDLYDLSPHDRPSMGALNQLRAKTGVYDKRLL